jgi:hypothetical protein
MMRRPRRALRTLLTGAALALAAGGAAEAAWSSPGGEVPDSTAASAAERRCDALADRFEALSAEIRSRAGDDDLTLLEAVEIVQVANELVAEGDAELAASLFEEALALLEPPETRP